MAKNKLQEFEEKLFHDIYKSFVACPLTAFKRMNQEPASSPVNEIMFWRDPQEARLLRLNFALSASSKVRVGLYYPYKVNKSVAIGGFDGPISEFIPHPELNSIFEGTMTRCQFNPWFRREVRAITGKPFKFPLGS